MSKYQTKKYFDLEIWAQIEILLPMDFLMPEQVF